MTCEMSRPATVPAPVDCSCSDGRPLAESNLQLEPVVCAITALRTHFRHRERVYVAGRRRRLPDHRAESERPEHEPADIGMKGCALTRARCAWRVPR